MITDQVTNMAAKLALLAFFPAIALSIAMNDASNHGDVVEILNAMQEHINQLKAENKQTAATLHLAKDEISQLKEENKQTAAALDLVREENRQTQSALKDLTRNAAVDSLFLATFSNYSAEVGNEEVIIWDTALSNPGGHFSTASGAYTAPYNGYYQFSVTKTSNDNQAYFFILVDEDRILLNDLITGGDDAPTSSSTINILLTTGQIVRVENGGTSTLIYGTDTEGYMRSWFTGYLLYAL